MKFHSELLPQEELVLLMLLSRLYNGSGGAAVVSMASTVGAADTVSFSMPAGHVELLEKTASYVIWADSASVRATKVGFTG